MSKVIPHVHWDGSVSEERVAAFADASAQQQRVALAELRKVAQNDEVGIQVGVVASVIAVLVVLLPIPRWVGSTDPLVQAIVSIVLGAIAVGVLLPFLIPVMIASARRGSAIALLGAYEDELARRRGDRRYRTWRKQH